MSTTPRINCGCYRLVDWLMIRGDRWKSSIRLGNVHPELLMGNVGVDVTVGSGEPLPESSVHGLDQGESFTFGNNGLD